MKRLFFDVIGAEARNFDYEGRRFNHSDEAISVAQLIALDLGCSETKDWMNSQVQVRNEAGETLFSIPIVMAA